MDYDKAKYIIDQNEEEIMRIANMHCQSMVKRGGGVIAIKHRRIRKGEFGENDDMVVELSIDVREAMGANITNTVCEGTAPYVQSILDDSRIGLRILSNLCLERMVRSEFKIPVEKLAWKAASGLQVAEGIIAGYNFAV